jgi:hypothetical protein
MSNVGQKFLVLYIAAAEQRLTCVEMSYLISGGWRMGGVLTLSFLINSNYELQRALAIMLELALC